MTLACSRHPNVFMIRVVSGTLAYFRCPIPSCTNVRADKVTKIYGSTKVVKTKDRSNSSRQSFFHEKESVGSCADAVGRDEKGT